MALDRPITIQRNAGMRNDNGEFADDWQDVSRLWAQRTSAGIVDIETQGGIRETESRQLDGTVFGIPGGANAGGGADRGRLRGHLELHGHLRK